MIRTLYRHPSGTVMVLAADQLAEGIKDNRATLWIDMLDHRNLLSHTYSPVVFEQAVQAIHTRYLAGMERLHDFMHREAMQ